MLLIQIHILDDKQCRPRWVGRGQLIWIYTVCKGRAYPGSPGPVSKHWIYITILPQMRNVLKEMLDQYSICHCHQVLTQTHRNTVSSVFSYPAILALLSLVSLLALDFKWANGIGNSLTRSFMFSSVTSLHLLTMEPSGASSPKQNGRNHCIEGKSWKKAYIKKFIILTYNKEEISVTNGVTNEKYKWRYPGNATITKHSLSEAPKEG